MNPFRTPPPTYCPALTERQGRAIIRAVSRVMRNPDFAEDHDLLVSAIGAISAAIPQDTGEGTEDRT